jgi:hypothetical protein
VKKHAEVHFKDGTKLEAEMLLYALGREANVEHLDIEKAGIALDKSGYIPVNALFQTIVAAYLCGGGCDRRTVPRVDKHGAGKVSGTSCLRSADAPFPDILSDRDLHDTRNFVVRLY